MSSKPVIHSVCFYSSQISDLADQLGCLPSCGSSTSGHHTCHSIGCTKVWFCWMMVPLKSFRLFGRLNIQRPSFLNAILIIRMFDTRNISDYLLLYSWFFSTAIYRSWKQNIQFSPLHQIFVTSSHLHPSLLKSNPASLWWWPCYSGAFCTTTRRRPPTPTSLFISFRVWSSWSTSE